MACLEKPFIVRKIHFPVYSEPRIQYCTYFFFYYNKIVFFIKLKPDHGYDNSLFQSNKTPSAKSNATHISLFNIYIFMIQHLLWLKYKRLSLQKQKTSTCTRLLNTFTFKKLVNFTIQLGLTYSKCISKKMYAFLQTNNPKIW